MKTKVLIVDDHKENITALSRLIAADDVEIFSAQDADEALNLLVDHDFGLALLDVQMPKVTGFELARLIRGVRRSRHMPMIFVTAHQRDQSVVLEGYETGAVDLLFKPLDPYVVRSKVRVFVQLDQQAKLLKAQMQEVERLKQEAEAANLAKSRFLANMSHEIRTPLGAILGFTELLRGEQMSPEARGFLDVIERNGQALTRLIDDILDLSKVEAGQMAIEHLPFSLKELVNETLALFSEKARSKGIVLKVDRLPTTGQIISDPARLRQILVNLVGNAVKFTEKGEVRVAVDVRATSSGKARVTVRVIDTGPGLTKEQSGKLFQPFVQADDSTSRKFGGTGLGLVLSRRLARAMGGDVWIESAEPGKGSAFAFDFEVDFAEPELFAENGAGEAARTPQKRLGGVKILVVDDSIDNRTLIKFLLHREGANIEEAASGGDAVEKAMANSHDIVLMDIQMPIMDGYDTLHALKTRGYEKPVIALTAHAMTEERQRTKAAGFGDHVTKPVDRESLVTAILKQID